MLTRTIHSSPHAIRNIQQWSDNQPLTITSIAGDIKIVSSQSQSFHPLTTHSLSLHPLTNQRPDHPLQSLPDLTEIASGGQRRSGPVSMTRSRQPETETVIQRMSPIQILFNDSGQYFVNFNLDNQNK